MYKCSLSIIKIHVPRAHEVKNQRVIAKRTSQIMKYGQDPIWEVVTGAPDRVNIPCLMHDTRLCQLDVKMTNNYHGTKSISIQNLSRCKKTGLHNKSKDQRAVSLKILRLFVDVSPLG